MYYPSPILVLHIHVVMTVLKVHGKPHRPRFGSLVSSPTEQVLLRRTCRLFLGTPVGVISSYFFPHKDLTYTHQGLGFDFLLFIER
jgi:hypothetical protein